MKIFTTTLNRILELDDRNLTNTRDEELDRIKMKELKNMARRDFQKAKKQGGSPS